MYFEMQSTFINVIMNTIEIEKLQGKTRFLLLFFIIFLLLGEITAFPLEHELSYLLWVIIISCCIFLRFIYSLKYKTIA